MKCIGCGGNTHIETRNEAYNVKGCPIEIEATVRVCDACQKTLWDKELDEQNLRNVYALYREQKGLLQSSEIKGIREKYALTQVDFARVLGLGDKTITRYENGTIQDEGINNLIRTAIEAPEFFLALCKENKHRLSASGVEAINKFGESTDGGSLSYSFGGSRYQSKRTPNDNIVWLSALSTAM